MKILYGVQGTGNGHITRARAMQKAFAEKNIHVDYVFSGRDRSKYFDMQAFYDWRYFSGLTFKHKAGKIQHIKTLRHNSLGTFVKDVRSLDVSNYDVVLSDFEPVTAWAAKLQGVTCIGIGHQMAFKHSIPKEGGNIITNAIMHSFCPSELQLGLHWHHFNQPILPPIAETPDISTNAASPFILVYLGFEELHAVCEFLQPFKDKQFVIFADVEHATTKGNITVNPLSREGFLTALSQCEGVITNAGFELSSEAIQLGKKLLVKPLKGQMEQLSNAKALVELDFGMRMATLDATVLDSWLNRRHFKRAVYPDVAKAITEWLVTGQWQDKTLASKSISRLANSLWQKTESSF